jgi:hypothetical protein
VEPQAARIWESLLQINWFLLEKCFSQNNLVFNYHYDDYGVERWNRKCKFCCSVHNKHTFALVMQRKYTLNGFSGTPTTLDSAEEIGFTILA